MGLVSGVGCQLSGFSSDRPRELMDQEWGALRFLEASLRVHWCESLNNGLRTTGDGQGRGCGEIENGNRIPFQRYDDGEGDGGCPFH